MENGHASLACKSTTVFVSFCRFLSVSEPTKRVRERRSQFSIVNVAATPRTKNRQKLIKTDKKRF
jgi:hypothetical protein